jgi:hypothetical protein
MTIDIILRVDPDREKFDQLTGVYVRAQTDAGQWVSTDIATLTCASFADFLNSRGPASDWAVGTARALLRRLEQWDNRARSVAKAATGG